MANTGRITGKDLYVTFGGTEISGDYTSVSVATDEDLVDVTAGADTYHYYLNTRQDGTIDFEAFYDGSTTTVWDAIAPGSAGTLIIAPKGTASGNPQWTWERVLVASRSIDIPFDDGVTVSASFQKSSEVSESSY